MKIRRRTIAIGFFAAVLAVVMLGYVLRSPQFGPIYGVWTSSSPFQGTEPGSVKLVIEEDGRVRVTTAPGNSLWWSADRYELYLRGDTIEVYSGQRLTGELRVRQNRRGLHLLDRCWPVETLQLHKADGA